MLLGMIQEKLMVNPLKVATALISKGRNCFSAGLYLPTSDIDLVVMDSRAADIKIALYAVSRKLHELGMARGTQVGLPAAVQLLTPRDSCRRSVVHAQCFACDLASPPGFLLSCCYLTSNNSCLGSVAGWLIVGLSHQATLT